MKKTIMKTMLLVMIAVVSLVMAATIAKATGIADTKHNLSTGGTGTFKLTSGTDQICVFCHTPHFSSSGSPLWNRTASVASYTMYSNPITIDMTIAGSPQGVSAACLSCHDGTVAFDALINKPGSGIGAPSGWEWANGKNDIKTSGAAYLSENLSNDHPISITYDITKDTAFNASTDGKVNGLPLYGSGKNQVECATCHNVHGGAEVPFLRVANAGSALCLKCHIK